MYLRSADRTILILIEKSFCVVMAVMFYFVACFWAYCCCQPPPMEMAWNSSPGFWCNPVLLISGLRHVSGCHLARLLISQFGIADAKKGAKTVGPQTINSPHSHPHPLDPKAKALQFCG